MKNLSIGIIIGLLVALSVAAFYVFRGGEGFPPDMLSKYSIKTVDHSMIAGTRDLLVVVGFEVKDWLRGGDPRSLIAFYDLSDGGARLIYKYSPVVPESAGYPRPLLIERAAVLPRKGGGMFIFTSWAEIGADYWGTHPVLFVYEGGRVRPTPFYEGRLSEDPRIKNISWTRKDLIAANLFDRMQTINTILTQGAVIGLDGVIKLFFYGDEKPHADKHKMIKFEFACPQ